MPLLVLNHKHRDGGKNISIYCTSLPEIWKHPAGDTHASNPGQPHSHLLFSLYNANSGCQFLIDMGAKVHSQVPSFHFLLIGKLYRPPKLIHRDSGSQTRLRTTSLLLDFVIHTPIIGADFL